MKSSTLLQHCSCSTDLNRTLKRPGIPSGSSRHSSLRLGGFISKAGPSQLEEEKAPQQKVESKRKAFGEWMVETSDPDTLEQPSQTDFWEGSKWDIVGKTAGFAIPVIATLLVLVGFVAAGSYMEGATSALQKPGSPDEQAKILPFPGTEE